MLAKVVVSLYCILAAALSCLLFIWTSSVVSLLYEAIYSSVSCARFERELRRVRESFGAVRCLLQVIANC